jgi:DNA (cytosine-5)-methyltransferase 1
MMDFSFIDLFCGCGGMSWGAKEAGFNLLAGFDSDPHAIRTYRRNFGEQTGHLEDLSTLTPTQLASKLELEAGDLDMLIGGPPCQGFSKNVPRSQRALDDPRNQLVNRFLEFVTYLRPKIVVIENVAEMKNGFSGAYTNEIRNQLECAGYAVNVEVLYAPDYGVPQGRRRAFFIANRLGQDIHFPAPTHQPTQHAGSLFSSFTDYVTVRQAIEDLPTLNHGEGALTVSYPTPPSSSYQKLMRRKAGQLHDHVARSLADIQVQRLSSITAGQGAKDLPPALRPKSHFSGAYGRLEWDAPAPTLTRWLFHPGSGRFGHPVDTRVITIREAARLQSFSDDFVFTGTYIQKSHQVGNAVPPLMMQAIAVQALGWLSAASARERPRPPHALDAQRNETPLAAD